MKTEKNLLVAVFRHFVPTNESAKLERLLPLWDSRDHKEMAKVLANEDLWVSFIGSYAIDISTALPSPSPHTTICPAKETSKAFAEMIRLCRLFPSLTMIYVIDCPPAVRNFLFHCLSFFDRDNGQNIFFAYNMDPTRTRVCVPMTELKIPLVIPVNKCELDYVPAQLRIKEPPPKPLIFPEVCPKCKEKLDPTKRFRLISRTDGSENEFCECQTCKSLLCILDGRTIVFSHSQVVHHGV